MTPQERKVIELALEASKDLCTEFALAKVQEILTNALAQPEQEPVAQCTESDSWNCKYCRKTESCKALQDPRNFASPPQRKPLTDAEILAIAQGHYNPYQRPEISFARAVEAAHNIKE